MQHTSTVNCKIFFLSNNEQQQYLKGLKKERNDSNSLSKFYWISSSAL